MKIKANFDYSFTGLASIWLCTAEADIACSCGERFHFTAIETRSFEGGISHIKVMDEMHGIRQNCPFCRKEYQVQHYYITDHENIV